MNGPPRDQAGASSPAAPAACAHGADRSVSGPAGGAPPVGSCLAFAVSRAVSAPEVVCIPPRLLRLMALFGRKPGHRTSVPILPRRRYRHRMAVAEAANDGALHAAHCWRIACAGRSWRTRRRIVAYAPGLTRASASFVASVIGSCEGSFVDPPTFNDHRSSRRSGYEGSWGAGPADFPRAPEVDAQRACGSRFESSSSRIRVSSTWPLSPR